MEAQHVDRASFAKYGVRDFHGRLPAGQGQEGDDRFDEAGMAFIERSIEVAAAPAHLDLPSSVQRAENLAQRAVRNRLDVAALNGGDELLRYAGLDARSIAASRGDGGGPG